MTTKPETGIKLRTLKIERLHGYYNYDISFNSDVTFLYGLNGCGKTIILDILKSVVCGQIYRLSKYDFRKVTLTYSVDDNTNNSYQTIVTNEGNEFSIIHKDDGCNIPRIEKEFFIINEGRETIYRKLFYNKYPFLCKISMDFDYANLLLDYIDELFMYNRTINLDECTMNRCIFMVNRMKRFLNVANEFFVAGKNPKRLVLDDDISFSCKDQNSNKCIDLKYLSLGEQKIIALFYYLIEERKEIMSRFLILDEPEKSLSLW